MRRLIIVFLLSLCQPTLAQYLQNFSGEKFDYQLKVKTFTNAYGLFGSNKGEAELLITLPFNDSQLIKVKAVIYKNQEKEIYWLKNSVTVKINQQKLKNYEYQLTDSTKKIVIINYPSQQIFCYDQSKFLDSLSITHEPKEIITAILSLINTNHLNLGDTLITYFISHDSGGFSSWELLKARVGKKLETLEVNGIRVDCYYMIFSFNNRINLGGRYTISDPEIWVSLVGRPVKLRATLSWYFIPLAIITAELKLN